MTRETQAIRDFCQVHGIPQPALARAYGCSQPAISQFLSGKRPIPDLARMIAALSEVLDRKVQYGFTVTAEPGEWPEKTVWIE